MLLIGIFKKEAKGKIPDHLESKIDQVLSKMEDFMAVEQHEFQVNPPKDSSQTTGRKKKELCTGKRWVVKVTDMQALLDYLVQQREGTIHILQK